MKRKILEFFKGIGTIGLWFGLNIIGALLFQKYYYDNNLAIATLTQLGTYTIISLGLCFAYRGRLIDDFKKFKKDNINIALKNWFMGLGIMMISNIIISSFIHNIAANESANRELLLSYPISSFISMIFIGPLMEEITFRASFQKAFDKWYTFALTTGIIFGLAHIAEYNLLEFLFVIPYGALGFFFAKAMYETNNIYTSFIAHMTHNFICVLLILLF
ncbi:MAG: CPBP family intramembrane metalloprotease [Bacilli bacterium]|nr:CPBP family intramembrane metalloprotease [Bacilli bacterium]